MRIISVLNLKGGVGKTMTALQMGYLLHHKYGKKVLLVDNDKQGNLSRAMGQYDDTHMCASAQLLEGEHINDLKVSTKDAFDIVTANMSLLTHTHRLIRKTGELVTDQYKSLRQALAKDGIPYDYIIIDNPPDLELNVINALMVTDDVIIPTRIDQWALDGLEIIRDQISNIKRFNQRINLAGILVTMYRDNTANMAGVEWLLDHGYDLFDEKIRYSEKVAESTLIGKNLEEYSPRSAAAVSYRKMVKEYRKRVSKYERNCNNLQQQLPVLRETSGSAASFDLGERKPGSGGRRWIKNTVL